MLLSWVAVSRTEQELFTPHSLGSARWSLPRAAFLVPTVHVFPTVSKFISCLIHPLKAEVRGRPGSWRTRNNTSQYPACPRSPKTKPAFGRTVRRRMFLLYSCQVCHPHVLTKIIQRMCFTFVVILYQGFISLGVL